MEDQNKNSSGEAGPKTGPLPSLHPLPGSAGPWWFRKSPDHQWRVVEVRNARPEGEPLLYADFDKFRPDLSQLSKRWPRQEWMKINPPNRPR
jgi:hypothetical protein